jgi:hypothetical protein
VGAAWPGGAREHTHRFAIDSLDTFSPKGGEGADLNGAQNDVDGPLAADGIRVKENSCCCPGKGNWVALNDCLVHVDIVVHAMVVMLTLC